MQALILDTSHSPAALTFNNGDYPKPDALSANDVLIRVAYAGVCGTDLHIIDGHFACKTNGKLILGHEFSGTVVAIGSLVGNVRIGDQVVVDPNSGCMTCDACRAGDVHFCHTGGLNSTLGIFRDGGFAQYARAPAAQVHRLPTELTLAQGALCEPLSCIAHAWDRLQTHAIVGKKVLVQGAGIIGNLWLATLHAYGHRREVSICEINPQRLTHVKENFGNVQCLTPQDLESKADMHFDVVIDCTGNGAAIALGLSRLRQKGVLCVFGVAAPETRVSFSPFEVFNKELTILGVKINPFTFPKALGLMQSLNIDGYLSYDKLGVKIFGLQEFAVAVEALRKGNIAKAMFCLDNE